MPKSFRLIVSAAIVGILCVVLQGNLVGAADPKPPADNGGGKTNLALYATPKTSYVSPYETLGAINDGVDPTDKADHSHGAYGNFPRSGKQWVEYDWDQPISTNKVDVYWWEDGKGIHLPVESRLTYWDGSKFVAVPDAKGLGVKPDTFNQTTFAEITTSRLRLEFDSDEKNSTGIIEWRVYDTGKSPKLGATDIARTQTSIKILYVVKANGQRIGGATGELILTATRGNSKGPTPVTFVSPVGDGMKGVLEDVLRAIRLNDPKWLASKVELSFDDREGLKDGGSIGAAIGTLLRSMLQGFEIDPKLAITGDVTADGKVRAIGGVAPKILGATASGCTLVVIPADNYPQLVDAFVFEGQALIANVQVIGVKNLDDAAALARVDRDPKIQEAINTFSQVQEAVKKGPVALHSKDTQDKLAHVLELMPQHFSAKLLQLVIQNKQPQKLSATASQYYASEAIQDVEPVLFDLKRVGNTPSAALQDAVRNLQKVKRLSDPQMIPLVNAYTDFVQGVSDYQSRRITIQALTAKAQAVDDALAKVNANHELIQKMLTEGI